MALLSGGATAPLFGGPSNHADADQPHQVYLPFIAKTPPIPPLSQELIQEAYRFYSPILGERDSLPSPDQLVYKIKPNLNHPDQPPIVFGSDPETGYIILATRTNWETYAQEWHVAGLRDLADALGIIVGSQFSSIYYPYAELENVNRLFLQEFNGAILEHTAWHTSEPQEGVFVFDIMDGMCEKSADAILANALSHKLYIKGDHIINPPSDFDYTYLRDMTDLTPERLLQIIRNHIIGVMNHFTGKISLYAVVNESRTPDELKPDGRPYDMFNVILGESYVEEAFRTARETDPATILVYNETRNETKQGRLYQRTKEIVDRLRPLGLIDGVGVQMHLDGSGPPRKQDVIEAFGSYGVPVYITEFDVDMSKVSGSQEERNEIQAIIYREMVEACLESGVCKHLWFWDVYDKYSWLDEERGGDPKADPTMFNDSLQPKPAYYAVSVTLQNKMYP